MTSANVVEYEICKDGEYVGRYRQNVMCIGHYEELLKYEPLNQHTITPWGYDEEEDEWYGDTQNLEVFLKGMIPTNKIIKEYFKNKEL